MSIQRLAGLLLCALALPVQAQTAFDTKLRDQLRQTILELRQLQDENASLKARLVAAPAAPPAAVKSPDSEAATRRARAEAAKQTERATALEQTVAQLQQQLAEQQKLATSSATALKVAVEREQSLQQQASALQTRSSSCEARNGELLKLSQELIQRYKQRSFSDVLLDREPLLGLHKIQFETILQEYEARRREQAVPKATP